MFGIDQKFQRELKFEFKMLLENLFGKRKRKILSFLPSSVFSPSRRASPARPPPGVPRRPSPAQVARLPPSPHFQPSPVPAQLRASPALQQLPPRLPFPSSR